VFVEPMSICRLTSEYTGQRKTVFKVHKADGFSSDSSPLSSVSEHRSSLHIQVCEILIYPTRTRNDCQSIERTLDPSSPRFKTCVYTIVVLTSLRRESNQNICSKRSRRSNRSNRFDGKTDGFFNPNLVLSFSNLSLASRPKFFRPVRDQLSSFSFRPTV